MFTRADKILIACLCLLAVAGIAYELLFMQRGQTLLEINVAGESQQLSLSSDRVLIVGGAVGDLQIEIKAGKARVQAALCPDHVCEKTGWISRAPQRIICVPNKVVVSIPADTADIDVIIQ